MYVGRQEGNKLSASSLDLVDFVTLRRIGGGGHCSFSVSDRRPSVRRGRRKAKCPRCERGKRGRRGRRRLEQLLHAEPSVKSLPPSPSFATAPNERFRSGLGVQLSCDSA